MVRKFAQDNPGIEIDPVAQGELNGTAGAMLAARKRSRTSRVSSSDGATC